jgi:hypothetical protein
MLDAQELADLEEGRWLGKKVPLFGQALGKLMAAAIRSLRERLNRAERREDIWREHARRVKAKRAADYTASSEAAVGEALDLVETYLSAGEPNWPQACREMEIHERTAQNLLALLGLYLEYPEAFRVFGKLGRSKLYLLARMPKEVLKGLSPEQEVEIGERKVTLADLSAKELKWYLKKVCPKVSGKRVPALKRHIEKCAELVDRPVKKLRMERGELAEAAEKLEIVLEKVRIRMREAS